MINMVNDFFGWLVNLQQTGKAELNLKFNGVDYDKNFSFNSETGVLFAQSSLVPDQEFGQTGITIAEHISCGNIEMNVKFK